jgi:hypothetical protein
MILGETTIYGAPHHVIFSIFLSLSPQIQILSSALRSRTPSIYRVIQRFDTILKRVCGGDQLGQKDVTFFFRFATLSE